jgi:DNA primase
MTFEITARFGARNGKAHCPAHDDRNASLSIKAGDDGRTLIHCFADCRTEDVLAAVGLTLRDLFNGNGTERASGRLVASYDYRDPETDELRYQKLRYSPKDFRIRRPNGKGRWVWKDALEGVPRVLYRQRELLDADPREWVFIVEGEKACDRLRARGFTSTTTGMGAGVDWPSEFTPFLRDRRVVLLADNDKAGRNRVWTDAELLLSSEATLAEKKERMEKHRLRRDRDLDRSQIRQLASCRWVEEHTNVAVTGVTGVGKTYRACALAHQGVSQGLPCPLPPRPAALP